MRIFRRIFILLLIVSIMNLNFPMITFGQAVDPKGQAEVTKHPPEFLTSPEVNIPVEKETKISSWTWVILGLVVVGGAAAAMALNKPDGPKPSPTTSTTGTASVGW